MNWRCISAILMILSLSAQGQIPKRMIDRCAQDGRNFWVPDAGQTIVADWDGVGLRVEAGPKDDGNVTLSYTHEGHKLTQKPDGFGAARGWLVVSPSAFAVTWNINSYVTYTQLFNISPTGNIMENTSLVQAAEKQFIADAKRICRDPGVNATAIKWIDDDRLLLSMYAWAAASCQSNFTEGFVLQVSANKIERKLTERELINLPAVCTWNIVPVSKNQ